MSVRLALAGLFVVALAPVGTAFAGTGGSIPHCPAGTSASLQRDCIVSTWVDPARYGTPVHASLKGPLSRAWVKASPSTGYAHWIFTGTVRIRSRLTICPEPVPLGSIPCQVDGPNVGMLWYQPGSRTAPPAPSGFSTHSIVCNIKGTSCVVKFAVYPQVLYGTLRLIWTVQVTQLTKNPAGDLGQAGDEFPVSLTVVKVRAP